MSPIARNILVTILGLIIGNALNLGMLQLGMSVVPAPEGVDPMDVESIKENIDLYSTQHFIFPFLAHALGTLAAAFVAVKLAVSFHRGIAGIIGVFFLIGGIMVNMQIGAPAEVAGFDIVFAYLPMAWLGYWLGKR